MKKIHVKVDPDLCIGAASCVTVDPAHFEMNEENKAWAIDEKGGEKTYERTIEVTDEQYETLLLAAGSCPTLAISLFDEAGNQLFPA